MSHAPVAEMDESEFNKHWDVMSTVSINKHSAFTMFERKALFLAYSLIIKTSVHTNIALK